LPVHIRSLLLLKAKPSGACFLPEVEFIFPLQLRACKSILGALLVYAVKELCGFSDNCCPTIDNHLLNVFFCRKRLFVMINNLPTIYEVVTGTAKKQTKEKTPKSSSKSNKSGTKV
jgi:hypothetical protein